MKQGSDIVGERTVAQMHAPRPLASRFKRTAAFSVAAILGGGVLTWYYTHLAVATTPAANSTEANLRRAVLSEMKLPAIHVPEVTGSARTLQKSAHGEATTGDDTPAAHEQAAPRSWPDPSYNGRARSAPLTTTTDGRGAPVLANPVSASAAGRNPAAADLTTGMRVIEPLSDGSAAQMGGRPNQDAGAVGAATAVGRIVPLRWLLPKGTFLDCTLETAIDSTTPGLATCILARDVYGADGRVVLLERGTKLIGEIRGDLRPGQARIAVIWTEARTPTGIIASLASPGTDELGRAGIPGVVDSHVGERFGAALLISMIDAAVSAVSLRQQGSGAVIYNTQNSRDVATEVLRNTIGIPPTIRVAPGTRVMVTVIRDIDFRSVYRLVAHENR